MNRSAGGLSTLYMLRVSQQEGSNMGAVGADGGKKRMKSGWMKLRSKLCFFSMGNTGVISQSMAPVLVLMTSVFFVLFHRPGKG